MEINMKINEYQELAMKTLNPSLAKQEILINAVMGLCGESGECIDVVKKHLYQQHDLDHKKLLEELGDVAWYLAEACTALDVHLEDVLEQNISKLKLRFRDGFKKEDSIKRKDVKEKEND